VDAFYAVTVIPMAQQMMEGYLSNKKNGIVNVQEIVDIPPVKYMCLLMTVRSCLHIIIPGDQLKRLEELEERWRAHVEDIRENIKLPSAFHNRAGAGRTALLLNRRLWAAIERLRVVGRVGFEWIFAVMLDALGQLDELLRVPSDDRESMVIEFAVAFSDAPCIISRFLLVNSLLVKRKVLHGGLRSDRFLELWSHLETAILKLLALKEDETDCLMNDYLRFQDEVMNYRLS
jgi:hypothetical protein